MRSCLTFNILRGVECIILAAFFGFMPVFATIVLTGGAILVMLQYFVTRLAAQLMLTLLSTFRGA